MVFYFVPPFAAQMVKAQAIGFGLVSGQQFGFQLHPLVGREVAFEYGVLYAHAIIKAVFGDAAQAGLAFGVG